MNSTAKRREFIEGAGLASLAAGVMVGDAAKQLLGGFEPQLPLGSFVVDVEAAQPDRAVVIRTPDIPIAEWGVGNGRTVAHDNPGYDPSEPVVIVAFADHLFDGWQRLSPAGLFGAVCDAGIKFYAFPASRLARA